MYSKIILTLLKKQLVNLVLIFHHTDINSQLNCFFTVVHFMIKKQQKMFQKTFLPTFLLLQFKLPCQHQFLKVSCWAIWGTRVSTFNPHIAWLFPSQNVHMDQSKGMWFMNICFPLGVWNLGICGCLCDQPLIKTLGAESLVSTSLVEA